jgi:SH3 domain protein
MLCVLSVLSASANRLAHHPVMRPKPAATATKFRVNLLAGLFLASICANTSWAQTTETATTASQNTSATAPSTTTRPDNATSATTPTSAAATVNPPANDTSKPATTAKPAFIIDNLPTALRSGPGFEYRTIASVQSGQAISVIGDNPSNKFVKVRDESGTEGWLSGDLITYKQSPKANLESMKQQLSQQEMMVAQFEQERQQLQELITKAEKERDQAVQEMQLAKATSTQLTQRLAEENPDLLHNKLVIGGGILLAGLCFGLLLPSLIPRRRDRDRWM